MRVRVVGGPDVGTLMSCRWLLGEGQDRLGKDCQTGKEWSRAIGRDRNGRQGRVGEGQVGKAARVVLS